MFDPQVHYYKTQLMQRIARAIHDGYYFHTSGTVHFSRIENLVQKFVNRFEIHVSEATRVRRKKEGFANAKLFLFPMADTTDFWFLLLLTEGIQEHRTSEKLLDGRVRGQRITLWRGDYELIQIPNHKGKKSWSWRYTATELDAVQERIRAACRQKHKQRIIQISRSLLSAPGFSVIREQTKNLRQLGYSEYLRAFGDNEKNREDNPFHLKKLHHWVRPSENLKFPLSTLIHRARNGEPSWYPPVLTDAERERELLSERIADRMNRQKRSD